MIKKCLFGPGTVFGVILILLMGCSKSEPQASDDGGKTNELAAGSQPQDTLVAKIHWLGKKQLYAETNATNFMAIWSMPESAKLEAQTLDKLSTAPWRLLKTATPLANAPVALLRPLLDDLVQAESYMEVHSPTNQSADLVFAIRLDADRAAYWRSNLPTILKSVFSQATDTSPKAPNTDASLQISEFRFDLARNGDWTLLSLSHSKLRDQGTSLLAEFVTRIQRSGIPFVARSTNYWIESEMDLRRLGAILNQGWYLLKDIPQIKFAMRGEGEAVRSLGTIAFEGLAPIEIEPWNIPTNLVHDPLIGFMAVRGFRPLLKAFGLWEVSRMGVPPNQAFFWSQGGAAPLHFFAVPSAQPSNDFRILSDFLLTDVNRLMAQGASVFDTPMGTFETVPDNQRLRWRGMPLVAPNVEVATNGRQAFVTGGLFPNRATNRPAPNELLGQFQNDSMLLYDWEVTGPMEHRMIQVGQLGRFVFGRARLSMTNNAVLPWYVAVSPKLGNAGTSIRLTSSNTITFSRRSSLGFTAVELHLLGDWLESPNFPEGLFTLKAKPVPPVPPGRLENPPR